MYNFFLYLGTRYQDSDCLQGTALGVSSRGGNRIPNRNFWASSSSSDVRQPYKARLEDSTGIICSFISYNKGDVV